MDGLDLAVDAHWLEDVLLDPDLEPTLLTTQEATRLVERRHEPEPRGSYASLQHLVSRLDEGFDPPRYLDESPEPDDRSQGSLDGSLEWGSRDSGFDSPGRGFVRYAGSRSASRDDPPFSFAPRIRQPKRYAPRLPFKQRNDIWATQQKQRLAEAKRRKESREMLECSFRPQVVSQSQDSHSPRRDQFVQRLSRVPAREKTREKVLADRERQLEEQCTFRPNTTDSKRTFTKIQQQEARSFEISCLSSKRSHSTIEEEPSFRPTTNAVPERMETAKAYLAENVFARLSSYDPAPEPEPEEREPGFDQEQLFGFLTRQNEREEARLDRLEKLAQETQASFQPALCARSRNLARTGASSRFGYTPAPRRPAAEPVPDPEATHAPRISAKAQRMPRRTVEDMSSGDAKRRELVQQRVRERRERDLARELQPPRRAKSASALRGAQGRVNADVALGDYIQRLRRKDQQIIARADESQASREARVLEDCTFAPAICKAPSYVSRMACASRARREAQPRDAPGRPEWR